MRTTKTIKQLINDFLSESITNKRSAQTYSCTLNRFFKFVSAMGKDVRNVMRADVMAYKAQLIAEGKSAHTIDNYLASVRQFFAWLYSHDYHDNVATGIKSPKRSRIFRKKALTPEQVKALLKSIPLDTPIGIRDYAMINLMVRTGMRCVEVERANVNDVVSEGELVTFNIQRKGRVEKEERIGLTNKTTDALNEYLVSRNLEGNPPLFTNHQSTQRIKYSHINRVVKKYLSAIGLVGKRYTAHSLRHTFACIALENGVSIYEVKAMLGHASISTTEIYTHMTEDNKRLINTPGQVLDEVY